MPRKEKPENYHVFTVTSDIQGEWRKRAKRNRRMREQAERHYRDTREPVPVPSLWQRIGKWIRSKTT